MIASIASGLALPVAFIAIHAAFCWWDRTPFWPRRTQAGRSGYDAAYFRDWSDRGRWKRRDAL